MIPYKITNFYSRYWIKWMAFHFPDGHVTPFFSFFRKAAATQLDNQLFTMEFNGQLSQAGESWKRRGKIVVNHPESSW